MANRKWLSVKYWTVSIFGTKFNYLWNRLLDIRDEIQTSIVPSSFYGFPLCVKLIRLHYSCSHDTQDDITRWFEAAFYKGVMSANNRWVYFWDLIKLMPWLRGATREGAPTLPPQWISHVQNSTGLKHDRISLRTSVQLKTVQCIWVLVYFSPHRASAVLATCDSDVFFIFFWTKSSYNFHIGLHCIGLCMFMSISSHYFYM